MFINQSLPSTAAQVSCCFSSTNITKLFFSLSYRDNKKSILFEVSGILYSIATGELSYVDSSAKILFILSIVSLQEQTSASVTPLCNNSLNWLYNLSVI